MTLKMRKGHKMRRMRLTSMILPWVWTSMSRRPLMPLQLTFPTRLIELPSHQNKKMESLLLLSRPLVVLLTLTFLLPLSHLVPVQICMLRELQLLRLLTLSLTYQLRLLHLVLM